MNQTNQEWCDKLTDYAFDVMRAEQRPLFEHHLQSCDRCRMEWDELQQTLGDIGLLAEEADPPAQLRGQVMSALFGDEPSDSQARSSDAVPVRAQSIRQSRWFYWTSAAVIVSVILGTIVNYIYMAEYRDQADSSASMIAALSDTSVIEQLVSLEPQDDSALSSYGVACVTKRGEHKELIIYVFGANPNEGTGAYQVWLTKDGQRSNAGTFQVGEHGVGVLTYAVDRDRPFDGIGITLEPDGQGERPRGPRLFASAEQIRWD